MNYCKDCIWLQQTAYLAKRRDLERCLNPDVGHERTSPVTGDVVYMFAQHVREWKFPQQSCPEFEPKPEVTPLTWRQRIWRRL